MRWKLGTLAMAALCVVACAPGAARPAASTPSAVSAPSPAVAQAPAAAAAPTAPAPANIRLALMGLASDAGLLIAQERGHFREQSLQVEPVQISSAAEMLPLLGAAQVDVGGTALTPGYLNAYARGVRIRIVADKGNTAPGWGYQGIVVRRALWDSGAVRNLADLRGRKLALPSFGSSSEVGIDRFVRPGGIHARDLDLTQLTFADMPAAIASGALDAAYATEPFITRMEADGSGLIWQREDTYYPNHQVAVIYYSEPFATERAEVARRFMVAYLQAVREYNDAFRKGDAARRADVVALLIKTTTVKDPALYERMVMPGLNPDGEVDVESLREDNDYWLANGYQEERVTVSDLVDHSFVRAALQQLGAYR